MLFVQAETQESVSRSVDPASGLCMLVFGALAGTPRLSQIHGLKQLVQSNDRAGLQVVGLLLFA